MQKLRFISRFSKHHRYKLIVMGVAILVVVAISLINPLILQFTIDTVILGQEPSGLWDSLFATLLGGVSFIRTHLWTLAVLIVVLNILSGFALFLRNQASGSFAENFTENLRNALYNHLQLLPYSYHVHAKTGDLIQRCTSDVDQISRFLTNQLREFLYTLALVTFALVISFSIDIKGTLIMMIAFPIIFIFAYVFFKQMQERFRKSDEAEAALANGFQEYISAVRVVKAFNRERFELEKFTEKNQDYRDKTNHVVWLLGLYWGVSDLICYLQILAVLIYTIVAARAGSITIGDAVVLVGYVSMILWPIRNVGRILADMGKVSVAIERLEVIFAEPVEDLDQGEVMTLKGDITFEDVAFMYDDGTENVLDGISFGVKAGETIAIMGPTGSGKSSLVHLLTRLYDPTGGRILMDGHDITSLSRRSLRSQVGLVLQEPYLFSKSIIENIRIADSSFAVDDVYNAARLASVHDVIIDFDQGYDTMVGEKGVTLSGGQKQRVAIARTMINKQPILIFDDSLSALDTETDAAIREALAKKHGHATTLIITHRVNSAMNADKIVVVHKGRVVQMGNHERLMHEEGLYRRIALIQNNQIGGAL